MPCPRLAAARSSTGPPSLVSSKPGGAREGSGSRERADSSGERSPPPSPSGVTTSSASAAARTAGRTRPRATRVWDLDHGPPPRRLRRDRAQRGPRRRLGDPRRGHACQPARHPHGRRERGRRAHRAPVDVERLRRLRAEREGSRDGAARDPVPLRLLRVEGRRRARTRRGGCRHPAPARRLRPGRHDAAAAHSRRHPRVPPRAARRRRGDPHPHSASRISSMRSNCRSPDPRAPTTSATTPTCCSRRCCASSSAGGGRADVALASIPYRTAVAAAAALEAAARVTRTRPRLTRYAVSQLGLERTLDLSAARERLGYRPRATSLDGAETW
jgi:hypothetical protein